DDFDLVFYRHFAAGEWTFDLRCRSLRKKSSAGTSRRAFRFACVHVVGSLAVCDWIYLLCVVSPWQKERGTLDSESAVEFGKLPESVQRRVYLPIGRVALLHCCGVLCVWGDASCDPHNRITCFVH